MDGLVPYSAQTSTCDTAKSVGDVCEFVTYAGAGHEIGITQQTDIENRAAHFIMDNILIRKGYQSQQIPAAA